MISNEITFFSNESYLGISNDGKSVKGEQYMKRWKYETISDDNYIFYYENKNNILTADENRVIIQKENKNKKNQLFKLQ